MLKRKTKDWYRFWSKVNKGPGCWEWQASCRRNGYGQFRLDGTMKVASRIVSEAGHGKIPKRIQVCHTCDNAKCIRPSHLFRGYARLNMRDACNKGRIAKGIKHHNAKLTDQQVRMIRKDNRLGKVIAKEYGISTTTVTRIKNRLSWKHIPEDTSDAPTFKRENKPQDSETTRHIQV